MRDWDFEKAYLAILTLRSKVSMRPDMKMQALAFIFVYLSFIFSPDMPKDQVWRETYKRCFIQCVNEGISKHACNLHCIFKADQEFYKRQKIKGSGDKK